MLEHSLTMKRKTDEQRALIREQLTPPPIPYWTRPMWSWCVDILAGASSAGAFGGLHVTWVDLDAWARRMKKELSAWQSVTLLRMAQKYLNACTTVEVPEKGAGG